MSGFIVFTFVDRDAEEFVTLGQTPLEPIDRLMERYEKLRPPNDPDSPFLADLWSDGECHDADKAVSADEIERILGGLPAISRGAVGDP